ncbi:MAG: hypothetical protein GYB65_02495 [Chloroflexi bacterium]|nr:hypothetical protein [Chloroflexota bacterium]
MFHKIKLIILTTVVVVTLWGGSGAGTGAHAQEGPDGTTVYQLNMRTGPGTNFIVITILDPNVGLVFEGRNEDMSWLLGHTLDDTFRGWVSSLYLNYTPGFTAARLPVSAEIIDFQTPAPAAPVSAPGEAPAAPQPQVTGIAPALEAVPVVPSISSTVYSIYARGQELGNNANVFAKVGECNTMSHAFLVPFGTGQYDLGQYAYLQRTIDFFTTESFTADSRAAAAGFTCSTVVDAAWSSPGCPGGLSPLECELDRLKPSVVIVMLGTHDVFFLTPQQYEQNMRTIIQTSIDRGVIPVLTTFPTWPGDYPERAQNRINFNTILVNLSREYGIPLINFWLAGQSVDHAGVGEDFVHLTERGDNWTSFNGDEYVYGFTMWNLVTLQTLDALYVNVLSQ